MAQSTNLRKADGPSWCSCQSKYSRPSCTVKLIKEFTQGIKGKKLKLRRIFGFLMVGLLAVAPLVPPLLVRDARPSGRIVWTGAYAVFLAFVIWVARMARSNSSTIKGISPRYGYSTSIQTSFSGGPHLNPFGFALALFAFVGFFACALAMSELTYAGTSQPLTDFANSAAQFGAKTLVFVRALADGAPKDMPFDRIQMLQAIFTVSIWYFLILASIFILNLIFGDRSRFTGNNQFSGSRKLGPFTNVFGIILGAGWTWWLYFHGPVGLGETICNSTKQYSFLTEACFSQDDISTLLAALFYGFSFVFMPAIAWSSFRKLLSGQQSG